MWHKVRETLRNTDFNSRSIMSVSSAEIVLPAICSAMETVVGKSIIEQSGMSLQWIRLSDGSTLLRLHIGLYIKENGD